LLFLSINVLVKLFPAEYAEFRRFFLRLSAKSAGKKETIKYFQKVVQYIIIIYIFVKHC